MRHLWRHYSKKLHEHCKTPAYAGVLTHADAEDFCRCVIGQEASEGALVKLYCLVDNKEGTIINAKFQAIGSTALIGALDTLCDMIIRKSYIQASRMSVDLLDRKLRDQQAVPAFPQEVARDFNLAVAALFEICLQCQDIIIADPYAQSPLMQEVQELGGHAYVQYWASYSLEEKLHKLQEVIKQDVEPYVALDEGGVEVKELRNDKEVIVVYRGSCTTCFSAIGSTLGAIQQILRDKVHPELVVVPDMSVLKLS